MVYKNTKENNYKSQKIKNSKGNRINNLGSKGQTKDFSKRRHLSKLRNRISNLRKKLI